MEKGNCVAGSWKILLPFCSIPTNLPALSSFLFCCLLLLSAVFLQASQLKCAGAFFLLFGRGPLKGAKKQGSKEAKRRRNRQHFWDSMIIRESMKIRELAIAADGVDCRANFWHWGGGCDGKCFLPFGICWYEALREMIYY